MSVTLSRQSGSATYTNQELAALITSLEASNNQHTVASGVAFYRISALRMLILDVDALHNRKLVETYAIHHDSTNPFELKFTSSNIDMNLDQALNGVGFSNLTPVTSLAAINAALYVASATDQYLATSTFVKSQGSFGVSPAELKTLEAGTGMTMDQTSDTVTLNVTPVQIDLPPPLAYGFALTTDDTFGESSFDTVHTHALQFTPPLAVTTRALGPGTIGSETHTDVKVTRIAADVYSKLEANNKFLEQTNAFTKDAADLLSAPIGSGSSVDVDAIKQAVLDAIVIGSGLVANRSVPGTLTLNVPPFETPTDFEYNFGSGLDAFEFFNPHKSTVEGLILPAVVPDNFRLEFSMAPTVTSNYYYIVSIHDGTGQRHGVELYHEFRFSPIQTSFGTYYPGGPYVGFAQTYNTNGQYYDIKIEKQSTGVTLFLDGVQKVSFSTGQYDAARMTTVKLASYHGSGVHFQGKMKNIKLSSL